MEINKLLSFSLSLVLILSVVESFDYNENELESEEGLQAMYDRWRSHHQVTEKSPEGLNAFKATVQHVHNHNKLNKPYKLGINKFAAMTNEEFNRHTHDENIPVDVATLQAAAGACPCPPAPASADIKDLPKRVDWREHNAVTPVKTRGRCGSSNLFAAVAAVEGINAIRMGKLTTLSEQQFLDCNGPHRMDDVYKYFKENGVSTNESYPYVGCKETCDKSKFGRYMVTIDGFEFLPPRSESALMKAVSQQPVAFGMDIGDEFKDYKGGVFTGPCGTKAWAMVLVGYDETTDGTKYWIAKNIYGETWGENGYVRLPRGLPDPNGACNMYVYTSIPTKSIETRNIEL